MNDDRGEPPDGRTKDISLAEKNSSAEVVEKIINRLSEKNYGELLKRPFK